MLVGSVLPWLLLPPALPEKPPQHFLAIRPITRHIIVAIASAYRGRFGGMRGRQIPRSALQIAAAAEVELPTLWCVVRLAGVLGVR